MGCVFLSDKLEMIRESQAEDGGNRDDKRKREDCDGSGEARGQQQVDNYGTDVANELDLLDFVDEEKKTGNPAQILC
jgi:hypothetical protein